MKSKRFTDEQIYRILQEAETGLSVADIALNSLPTMCLAFLTRRNSHSLRLFGTSPPRYSPRAAKFLQ